MVEKNNIGLVEFKSIPVAMYAVDAMLKAANVELVFASPVCPGKYMAIVCGDVSAVKTSVRTAVEKGEMFCISSQILSNVHPDVIPALTGVSVGCELRAIGLLESMSAITGVRAADIAAKSANVRLVDIRLARGLGGKSCIIVTGEVSSVKTAIKACEEGLADQGDITSVSVISQPHRQLRQWIL